MPTSLSKGTLLLRSLGILAVAAGVTLAISASLAHADPGGTRTFRVTIENLTPAGSQPISPALYVAHSRRLDLFEVGQPASQAVSDVAEDAIAATGIAALTGVPGVGAVGAGPGAPIGPGAMGSFEFTTRGGANTFSMVAMLVNTNDAFIGLDSVPLTGGRMEYYANAYDAGSEVNDQLASNIPGPCCGDTGRNGTDEFGVIMHHMGIQAGVGDLSPATYGWNVAQPAARIVVERVR